MTSSSSTSTIAGRLRAIRQRIADAEQRAGRPAGSAQLVAVSKNHPASAVLEAYQAGQRLFGENRVAEALDKMGQLPQDIQWHLVGPLQSNKARHVPGRFSLFHSLHSADLAQRLNRLAAGQPLAVLVQMNLSGEPSKNGLLDWDQLAPLLEAAHQWPQLAFKGLMTIPDPTLDEKATRRLFGQMRQLLAQGQSGLGLAGFDQLSMGMTADFEWAVEEGATLVRVGTAIFGERDYGGQ